MFTPFTNGPRTSRPTQPDPPGFATVAPGASATMRHGLFSATSRGEARAGVRIERPGCERVVEVPVESLREQRHVGISVADEVGPVAFGRRLVPGRDSSTSPQGPAAWWPNRYMLRN